MKIYSRTGDLGETGLYAGPRVGKDIPRIEALGTIDELNAMLGLVRTEALAAPLEAVLERVQNELFEVGAELSTPDPAAQRTRTIGPAHVQALEADVDRLESGLAPLDGFILPGGSRAAAGLHLARAVCRRAERRLVGLVREAPEEVSLVLMAYLNRLADLLFVLARAANAQAALPDVAWKKPGAPP
jgi:cob(I)alamin adenosyltransferase